MKKKKFKLQKKHIVIIILLALILFLTVRIKLNNKLITDLSANKYDYGISRVLKMLNINEKYIIYYNTGNLYYNEGKYTNAVEEYEKSLEYSIPSRRICNVRVNLGLAKLATITDTTKKDEKEKIVMEIISILDGDDCSTNDYDAKKFKEELLQQSSSGQSGDNQSSGGSSGEEETDPEEQLEQQLEEIQQQAQSAQEQETSHSEQISGYSYYSGQKW